MGLQQLATSSQARHFLSLQLLACVFMCTEGIMLFMAGGIPKKKQEFLLESKKGATVKLFFTLLIFPFIVSCVSADDVTLSYSSIFKISLAAEQLSGGTIFYADELSLKSNGGTLVSGKIISTASEGLPETLDIRQYPEYVLGLKEIENENAEIDALFHNSSREIRSSYDVDDLIIDREAEHTTYSLCKADSCLAFMVKNNFDDHIFTVHANGYDQKDFIELLKGVVHVN